LLDEALELVVELWQGEPVTHSGPAYKLDAAVVRPTPLRRPPVWIACVWPHRRPLRRAARYDGLFPVSHVEPLTGADLAEMLRVVGEHREPGAGAFDLVVVNNERADTARLAQVRAAGATWWLQGFGEAPLLADVLAAAVAGPPE
jgi:alkanesulfonate monooxygenase SsuD/methylene tetrahydromethanopterin reductase-like flavin-dependent oxidoreductase (luciferase family)